MKIVKKCIRALINKGYRESVISNYKLRGKIQKRKRDIVNYLQKKQDDEEISSIVSFMRNNINITYPYEFSLQYNPNKIEVFKDFDNGGGYYVLHNGKRLYARKSMKSAEAVKKWYNGLLCSQDVESPHRYLKDGRYPHKDAVVADCGAAEGVFALDIVDYAKRVYLFECDADWLEPLALTFAPYKDKVEIVNKFVGDKTEGNMVRLDDFFGDKEIDYIKADIEGWEEAMLAGAENVLESKARQILCCVYHKQDSEKDVSAALRKKGFSLEVNPHYMIFLYAEEVTGIPLSAPYLRHGVLYAHK